MTDDVYKRLRAFFDRLPGGFPETDTGVEIKILKKMYNPAEAITLIAKPESDINETFAETLQQILVERGIA